jgi:hypothetical protein
MRNTNFECTHFENLFWLRVTFFLTSPDFPLTPFSDTIFIFIPYYYYSRLADIKMHVKVMSIVVLGLCERWQER